eukprot:13218153-Ditylum_brightwellii.AAC.1
MPFVMHKLLHACVVTASPLFMRLNKKKLCGSAKKYDHLCILPWTLSSPCCMSTTLETHCLEHEMPLTSSSALPSTSSSATMYSANDSALFQLSFTMDEYGKNETS